MDTVSIGLGIAIVVIVVLVFSCRRDNRKRQQNKVSGSCNSAPVNQVAVGESTEGFESNTTASTGSAVLAKQLNDQYSDLINTGSSDNDWSASTQYMALEPEVFASQKDYNANMAGSIVGSSMMSVRDDPNDIVSWVGLRRPQYRDVYSGEGSRTVSSETPDQMNANRGITW
jgi:hypothetical protein